MKVLVVDDEPGVRAALQRALTLERHDVHLAEDGQQALDTLAEGTVDAIVLDVMMPRVDGLEVCRRLRAAGDRTPVLMLTARDAVDDRVDGLDAGADDYLVKPFKLPELLARVRAHLRRTRPPADDPPQLLEAAGICVDPASRRVHHGDRELALRPKEFDLLALLVAQAGRVVTRQRIMREVWNTDWMGSTKTLDNHILTLRSKLGDGAITTLRGIGYRLEA